MIGNERLPPTKNVVDLAASLLGLAVAVAGEQPEHLDQAGLEAGDVFGVELDLAQVVVGAAVAARAGA